MRFGSHVTLTATDTSQSAALPPSRRRTYIVLAVGAVYVETGEGAATADTTSKAFPQGVSPVWRVPKDHDTVAVRRVGSQNTIVTIAAVDDA